MMVDGFSQLIPSDCLSHSHSPSDCNCPSSSIFHEKASFFSIVKCELEDQQGELFPRALKIPAISDWVVSTAIDSARKLEGAGAAEGTRTSFSPQGSTLKKQRKVSPINPSPQSGGGIRDFFTMPKERKSVSKMDTTESPSTSSGGSGKGSGGAKKQSNSRSSSPAKGQTTLTPKSQALHTPKGQATHSPKSQGSNTSKGQATHITPKGQASNTPKSRASSPSKSQISSASKALSSSSSKVQVSNSSKSQSSSSSPQKVQASSSTSGASGTPTLVKAAGHSCKHQPEVVLPQTRVKIIMKSSPDIEQVGQDVVYLITKATECFIDHLASQTFNQGHKVKNVEYKHLAEMTQKQSNLEFLRDIIPVKMLARDALKEMAKQKAQETRELLE